jgi:clan AA aspartic protease (TIGR02281 family)
MKIPIELPIVLRVRITGPEGFREVDMIFDSGAAYTDVSWDVAKDIGYDPAITERRARIITANGPIEIPLICVESVSLGDLKVDNVDVICHDIPEMVGIEGLLGLSFLEHFEVNFEVNIDLKRKTLEIRDP